MNQRDSFIVSVSAVNATSAYKLRRLLLDRRMVRLIVELVGNRSFTLTTANGKWNLVTAPQEWRPIGIHHGTPSLLNIYTSDLPSTASTKYLLRTPTT